MAEDKNREGQPAASDCGKPAQTPPADAQADSPVEDPKTRGQQAASESDVSGPGAQPDAPKPAAPKADPKPVPAGGASQTKPQGSDAGAPPKPATPPAKPAAPAAKPPAGAPAKPSAPAPPKPPAVMVTTPWESELTAALKAKFGDAIAEFASYAGQNFLVTKPEAVIAILEYLKNEQQFDYLVDVTAVDYPKRAARFDLVYILYSFARNERIRIKTQIAEGYKPESAAGVHLTANWLEREVFDMFGIEFAHHPDMKRILMPDEWQGYPLRKDYSITAMDNRWVQENLSIESGQ